MKQKWILSALSAFFVGVCSLGIAACDFMGDGNDSMENSSSAEHTHVFDREVETDDYKASEATCDTKASYYYSCECGEKGENVFERGDFLHTFDEKVLVDKYKASDASCTAKATYYYSCECGEKGEELFEEGEKIAHNMENGRCTVCGKAESEGLAYTLTADGESYIVTGIGSCTETDLVIPATHEGKKVIAIADYAFSENHTLESVTFGSNVQEIGERAFTHCVNLHSVVLSNSVVNIKKSAFYWCIGLERVEYLGSMDEWSQITFADDKANPLSFGEFYKNGEVVTEIELTNVTEISKFAFYGGGFIESVVLPDGLKNILEGAFTFCSITSITIPDSVESIGAQAFRGCGKLQTVNMGNGVVTIGAAAFEDCSGLKSIVLPNSVTKIGEIAFQSCLSLTHVTLSDNLIEVGYVAFADCQSLQYKVYDGLMYLSGNTNPYVYCVGGRDIERATIQDGCRIIGKYANNVNLFSGIKELTIPDTLVSFDGLTCINSGDGPNVLNYMGTIEQWAQKPLAIFAEYDLYIQGELARDVVLKDIDFVEESAFRFCTSLRSIVIPESVTRIGSGAFYDCYNLESITLPSLNLFEDAESNGRVESLGASALKYIELTASEYIVKNAFWGYGDRLETIKINKECKEIREEAFAGCWNVKNIEFEVNSELQFIGDKAFQSCVSLTSFTIPASVERIGQNIFNGYLSAAFTVYCESSASLAGWDENWHSDDRPIVWDCLNNDVATDGYVYVVDNGIRYAISGNQVFVSVQTGCDSTVYIPGKISYNNKQYAVVGLMENAFSQNTWHPLQVITLPKTIQYIGSYAFWVYSEGLTIYYGGSSAEWKKITFGEEGKDWLDLAVICFA